MEDYSRKLRDAYKNTNEEVRKFVSFYNMNINVVDEQIYKTYGELLKNLTNAGIIYKVNMDPKVKLMFTLLAIHLYTDLYKRLNYLDKQGLIEEKETKLLLKVKNISNYNDVLELIYLHSIDFFIPFMRFNNLSAYDKVLEIKSLTESDYEKILAINPFFETEYQKYNVEINEDFIARQIKKWLKSSNNDYEKSYEEAVKFITRYEVLDSSLKSEIEEKYPSEDILESIKKLYLSKDEA